MKIFIRCLLIGLASMFLFPSALPAAGEEQAAHAARQPADVAALLDSLGRDVSRFKTLKTDFTQEKRLAVFQNTVLLRGRIFLQKPARIAWHVDAPLKYSVVI
ncbi:MAG TPA: outer-membrane lipoprotein carrier protein LolA, partial [Nitrospirota bacterium]|nr:outer-membrane lipoprotein carrier protein LolA [Nitrospirota bacterium]